VTEQSGARLTFRVSRQQLTVAVIDKTADNDVRCFALPAEPGKSVAARVRRLLQTAPEGLPEAGAWLSPSRFTRAQVLIDSPVMLVPDEEFSPDDAEELYQYSFPDRHQESLMINPLAGENAVAVFSVNRDLKQVLEEHFADIRFLPVMQPVWSFLHQRGYEGTYQKLFGYFHDRELSVVSFDRNRFRFYNQFDVAGAQDAAYFLMYVWRQLAFDPEKDELHLAGDIPDRDALMETLRRYLLKVSVINPSAEFMRAPITRCRDLPFDLLTLFVRGR